MYEYGIIYEEVINMNETVKVEIGNSYYNIPVEALESQASFDAALLNAQIRKSLKGPSVSDDEMLKLPGLEGMSFAS